MSGMIVTSVALVAGLCGGIAAGNFFLLRNYQKKKAQRRAKVFERQKQKQPSEKGSRYNQAFALMERLTKQLFTGATLPLSPTVRSGKATKSRAGVWYKNHAQFAGCAKEITAAAYCEARTRLMLIGAVGGALIGVLFSTELSFLMAVIFAIVGRSFPTVAIKKAIKNRALVAELHLSEMLEIVSLGLRSGLTFDRSFALYGNYFNNEFAQACKKAYRSWSLGLSSREDALHEFASSFDCSQLSRVVDSIIRSLRFGSALAGILEDAGAQARATYRAALEERVAKAPVKMMMPTGTLILPAMLLLVVGPVLLELAGGF